MLTSFANAGVLDEELLDHALTHSGYDDFTIPYIKQMMHSLASGELKTISSSVAMSRYQEGFEAPMQVSLHNVVYVPPNDGFNVHNDFMPYLTVSRKG